MYGIKVIHAFEYDNKLVLGGEKLGNGTFNEGDLITDGEHVFCISGIPFVRYLTPESANKNMIVEIVQNEFSNKHFEGKTLIAVQ